MKHFLILFNLLLLTFFSNGQSGVNVAFANGICQCLDSLNQSSDVEHSFPTCFALAIDRNNSEIVQEMLETYGDTTKATINKFTDTLEVRASIYLIGTCTPYFKYVDSLHNQQYKNLDKDSLETLIKKLENLDVAKRNKTYYTATGIVYFQLRLYDKALESVEKVLSEEPANLKSLFIKASILDSKQNYDEAIQLYDQVANLSHQNSLYIYSAMAKRKKKGF